MIDQILKDQKSRMKKAVENKERENLFVRWVLDHTLARLRE